MILKSIMNCLYSVMDWFKPQVYYQMNVLLIGLQNSGKTSLIQALQRNKVENETVPTLKMETSSIRLVDPIIVMQPSRVRSLSSISSLRTAGAISSLKKSSEVENGSLYSSNNNTSHKRTLSMKLNNDEATESSPLIISENMMGSVSKSGRLIEQENLISQHKLILKVYDLSGQYKYHNLWNDLITNKFNYGNSKQVNLIIYTIDISDEKTIEISRNKLIEVINLNNEHNKLPILILCNKIDLLKGKDLAAMINEVNENRSISGSHNGSSTNGNSNNSNSISHSSNNNNNNSKKLKSLKISSNNDKHQLMLNYFGIELRDDKMYLHGVELMFDLGLFIMSLKDINNEGNDRFGDVINWISGKN